MIVFTPLSILILAMLIITSMKLIPGIFAYLYHHASGKYSAKKVGNLCLFFILGVEVLPALLFVVSNFLLCALSYTKFDITSDIILWSTAGLLVALGIAFFCFYFRRDKGTKLFISRKTASNFRKKATLVETNSDAFILGLISGIPELLFTFPLYLITLIEITKSFILPVPCSMILILFILAIISPLFFLYVYFRAGNNLADFLRLREKNKTFFRFFVASLYFLLALIIILLKVIF